jgi:hypothetical protein
MTEHQQFSGSTMDPQWYPTINRTCTRVRTTSRGAQAVTATARPTPPASKGAQMPQGLTD